MWPSLDALTEESDALFLHVWQHVHNLAGSCVQVYSALVLVCFHKWLFFFRTWEMDEAPTATVETQQELLFNREFWRRKVVHQPLITTHWCVIWVWRFRYDIWGRWRMMYLAEVIFTLLVRSIRFWLFMKASGGPSLLLLTKSYSFPHLSLHAASLVFSWFEGLRWTVDSFSAVKKLFWSIQWLKITVVWLN